VIALKAGFDMITHARFCMITEDWPPKEASPKKERRALDCAFVAS
jgi:hypothetical protein